MEEEQPSSTLRSTRSLDRNTTQRYGRFCNIFLNGDEYFKGHTMYISPRLKTLDAVKDEITISLNNRTCPRNIFTPTRGSRVQTLQELLECSDCVIGPSDTFCPLP